MGHVEILIIIQRRAIERSVPFQLDASATALRVLFEDAGVGEIVNGHAVGETNGAGCAGGRVIDGEVVVVIGVRRRRLADRA